MKKIAIAGLLTSAIFALFYGSVVNMIYPCPPIPTTLPCNFGRILVHSTIAVFFGLIFAVYLSYIYIRNFIRIRNKDKLK